MDGRTLNPMKRAAQALSDVLSDSDSYNNPTFDRNKVRISFEAFAKILKMKSVCFDTRTIKARWDTLLSQGVLTNYGSRPYEKAFFSIPTFNEIYGELGVTPICTHTYFSHSSECEKVTADCTHTYFSEGSE